MTLTMFRSRGANDQRHTYRGLIARDKGWSGFPQSPEIHSAVLQALAQPNHYIGSAFLAHKASSPSLEHGISGFLALSSTGVIEDCSSPLMVLERTIWER